MNFYATFFINISILITSSYLFNLLYKNLIQKYSYLTRHIFLIVIFIFSGWLAMSVGVKMNEGPLFDLRNVPIIVATLMFSNPRHIVLIGLGMAGARYFVNGMSFNAVTGSLNIFLLGLVAAGLVMLYARKKEWNYRLKATISLLAINISQVAGILIFGAVPRALYFKQVMPYTLPLGLLLGAFFLFIIHDFYKEQLRVDELSCKNKLLLKQTEELSAAKKELEGQALQIIQASKYKSDFMANMSHELRTPLNSIIILSQLIRENDNDKVQEEHQQYADIIHESSNELLRIINDILDLSKVEAGKMEIDWAASSIEDVTQLVYYQLLPMAEKKQLDFKIHVSAEVPEVIVTDALRLSQILRNLLSNAVKFTDQGSITLRVSLDPANSFVLFTVKDTGIGIEENNQLLIFDAFQQEDGTINRKYEGTGLGLSISQQLAKLLGGKLTLRSAKGKGSEFTLHLPITPTMKQG
nr:ATP-binding protein [Paenibacillus castaneae]